MKATGDSPRLPGYLWALLCLYSFASLVHFIHNAEYIAFYPNMPAWLTSGKVYGAWLVISSVGLLGTVLAVAGWLASSALVFAAYGALGLDGLGHYTLALCSEHTFTMNFTIWFEVAAGIALALAACRFAGRQASARIGRAT